MSCRRKGLPQQSADNDVTALDSSKSSNEQGFVPGPYSASKRLIVAKSSGTGSGASTRTSKKESSWLCSSFGGFDNSTGLSNKFKKKQTEIWPTSGTLKSTSNEPSKDTVLWLEKYAPKNEAHLAVHKKKVAELRSWLLEHLCGKPSSAILLMTGPAGSGKTATLNVLTQELGCELQEWVNPLSSTPEVLIEFHERGQPWDSQSSLFRDFLLRANRYPTLLFGKGTEAAAQKIVLIEDLPNFILRESGKLHEILSNYQQTGKSPVVFIISDSHHGNTNVHQLFPKDVQERLRIHNISFNPVAHTSMVKTINKIACTEAQKGGAEFAMPSKETVEALVQSCAGDIRAAVNALQFYCLREKPCHTRGKAGYRQEKKSLAKRASRKRTPASSQEEKKDEASQSTMVFKRTKSADSADGDGATMIGGRDTPLFLFKSLGKILYCKRSSSASDANLLPVHLSRCVRNELQFCPEEVIERTHLSSDFFNLYLHQNYLGFFSDVDDVVSASEYLSDADVLSADWMHRVTLREYAAIVAARGLAYSNHNRPTSATGGVSGGWRSLHKPQWFEVNKKARNGFQAASTFFRDQGCPPVVLCTEILPYLAITDLPLNSPGQISFLQQVGHFSRNRSPFRSIPEALGEKDCGDDSEQVASQGAKTEGPDTEGIGRRTDVSGVDPLSDAPGSKNQVGEMDKDEEEIMDFDDDW